MEGLNILQTPPAAVTGTLEVTEAAAQAIGKFLKENGAEEGAGLRVGVRGGGCSGLSYFLEPETEEGEGDHVIDAFGAKVFVDPKSLIYLQGSKLDFVRGLMESGFKLTNPQEGKSCGCGESFTPN